MSKDIEVFVSLTRTKGQMKDVNGTEKGHKGRGGKGRGLSEDVSKTGR